ncbi:dipeptidyl peptidase 9-like [Dreissena polymorpha]|nr:dipeptidyl peptidase 9-like [Dreissena polymorpha]
MGCADLEYTSHKQNNRTSWFELKSVVKDTRKVITSIASRAPSSFTFKTQETPSGPITRLYFLGIPERQRESTVMYENVPLEPSSITPLLEWCPLLETSNASLAGNANMSKEEQLMRERKRLGVYGITSFEVTDERRLLFPAGNSLNTCTDSNLAVATLTSKSCAVCVRYTGYWWDPVCRDGRTYRILYEEVNDSEVDIVQIYLPLDDKGVDEYRYPRAGKTNADSCLKMAQFTVGNDGRFEDEVIMLRLFEPLSSLSVDTEYLARSGWTPDCVHCQMLNRVQTNLTLYQIPRECFVTDARYQPSSQTRTDAQYEPVPLPPVHVLLEETSDIWVNLGELIITDILHFLPARPDSRDVEFLWMSERSGYRHLYRVSASLTHHGQTQQTVMSCEIEVTQITTGDWEVSSKEIWVDETRGLVYFLALKDTPLETHLYVVSYQTPGPVYRLTELGYTHNVTLDKACSMFVTVFSAVNSAPQSALYRIEISTQSVQTQPLVIIMSSTDFPVYSYPEMFNYKSKSGHTMYGMYYRPDNYQQGVKYPTVMFLYGGPHVQLVTNSFKGLKHVRLHTLAAEGFAVVIIDGRGSCSRGITFESHIKNRLGTTEIEDQVEGLQWLASRVDFIDEDRIAIHGWSYGGYLSLMGLAQRPDIFKVSIAGAPVVDWHLYDTGYTERYMDLPTNNLYGYHLGNVLICLDSSPEEENRLLINHGLMGENVHFLHTSKLVNALVKACKPHTLQLYPNERHGIRSHEASEHYRVLVLNFLKHNL